MKQPAPCEKGCFAGKRSQHSTRWKPKICSIFGIFSVMSIYFRFCFHKHNFTNNMNAKFAWKYVRSPFLHLFGPTQLSPIFRLFAAGPWQHRTKKAKGNHQIHGEKWKCCWFHNDVSGSDFCCSSTPLIQMLFLLLDLQGMVFRSRTVATAPTQSIATRCYYIVSICL